MASQKIYLSSETPWQALYTTSEGYVVYKTECPPSWTAEVKNIKILRALPPAFCYNGTNNVSFAALAEIQYHTFRTAQIRFYDGGKTQLASEFLRKKGLSFLGRNRVFTGPHGKEYMWKIGSTSCKLFANDSSNAPIAVFLKAKGGFMRESRPAYLEIFGEGEYMMDLIVMTFVYMEKLRIEKEDMFVMGAEAIAS